MSELERLTEALDRWLNAEDWTMFGPKEAEALIWAASAYRDLLANGERAWWCAYEATAWAESEPKCDGSHGFGYEGKCGWAIVSRLLSVYPKEAENE